MASIPLLCNICPKQRKFSDISHLLTHVGSKGHLSHYFKIQVRSRQEPSAREQLAAYDRWYEKHEVERLLSERLTLKESKKANSKRRPEKHIAPSAHRRETTLSGSGHHARVRVDESLLDPQLSQQYVKEDHPRSATALLPMTEAASKHRTYIPRMHLWPTAREKIHEMAKSLEEEPLPSIDSEDRTGSDDSHCRTPSVAFAKSCYPDPSTASGLQDDTLFDSGPSILTGTVEDDDAESLHHDELDLDQATEGTKLKGVFWPGMDIFDSATPEMRRKRNQKKDGSILEKMMISAAEVEPTELVFTPEGSLKKQRPISGMAEDSSPVKEETPKPKRRRSNPKKSALTEISGNLPRIPRINKGPKLEHNGRRPRASELGEASRSALAVLGDPSVTGAQSNSCHNMPTEDEDTEWRLTLGDIGHRKKFAFTIFDDSDRAEAANTSVSQGPAQNFQEPFYHGYSSRSFGHPHGLTLLSSEFHHPSNDLTANTHVPAVGQDQKLGSSLSRPIVVQTGKDDKENIRPIVNWSECMDQATSLPGAGRKTQQYFSVEGAHSPQFYHTLPPHMEFGAFAGPVNYAAFSNPLTYTFQQPYPQQKNGEHLSQYHSFVSPQRRMSKPGGSDTYYHCHYSSVNVEENEDERMLFGDITD
ncbi:MAG: hypothetical protein M1830_005017 [Pleopsidium flavum]|nr:MAG: hypothetical protein M1830_005017 [Pleopsidium flavum]